MSNGTTTGTYVDPMAGQQTGAESSLSSWAGPYVTEMLGRGQALASMPYQAYTGPLTAGPSALQNQAFSGLASLAMPTAAQTSYTPQSFTGTAYAARTTPATNQEIQQWFKDNPNATDADIYSAMNTYNVNPTQLASAMGWDQNMVNQRYINAQAAAPRNVVQQYMSPYLMAALEPQIAEARRQAEIKRIENAGRMTRAGAYGGGRQAIMESELDRNLLRNLADITGRGYQDAFTAAQNQFNKEEEMRRQAAERAQTYGLDILKNQQTAGATQRDIESQGIAADIKQFEDERDYPYKQVQYMQSLLQGLPLQTQSYSYQEPTGLSQLMGGAGSILDFLSRMNLLGGGGKTPDLSGLTPEQRAVLNLPAK